MQQRNFDLRFQVCVWNHGNRLEISEWLQVTVSGFSDDIHDLPDDVERFSSICEVFLEICRTKHLAAEGINVCLLAVFEKVPKVFKVTNPFEPTRQVEWLESMDMDLLGRGGRISNRKVPAYQIRRMKLTLQIVSSLVAICQLHLRSLTQIDDIRDFFMWVVGSREECSRVHPVASNPKFSQLPPERRNAPQLSQEGLERQLSKISRWNSKCVVYVSLRIILKSPTDAVNHTFEYLTSVLMQCWKSILILPCVDVWRSFNISLSSPGLFDMSIFHRFASACIGLLCHSKCWRAGGLTSSM